MSYSELVQQLNELNKKMAKTSYIASVNHNITSEGVVLGYLRSHNGISTPGQLAGELGVTATRISALLKKMEQKKLIERKKRQDNKKSTWVCLLAKGNTLNTLQQYGFEHKMTRFLESLGETRAKEFVQLQTEMVDFMARYNN